MFSRGAVRKGTDETQLAMTWKPWRLWMMTDTQRFITLIYLNRKYVNEHRTHTHKHMFLLKTVFEGQPNRTYFSLQIYLFIESEIKSQTLIGHRIFK